MGFQKREILLIYIHENKISSFNYFYVDYLYSFRSELLILEQVNFAYSAFVIATFLAFGVCVWLGIWSCLSRRMTSFLDC